MLFCALACRAPLARGAAFAGRFAVDAARVASVRRVGEAPWRGEGFGPGRTLSMGREARSFGRDFRPILWRGLATERGVIVKEEPLSEHERMMLDEHMMTSWSGFRDSRQRRERVISMWRYLQEELGVEAEEAWEVLSKGVTTRLMLGTPIETIHGVVIYFKQEWGWSDAHILRVLGKDPEVFTIRNTNALNEKVEMIQDLLGMTRLQAIDWLTAHPRILRSGDLQRRLEYALGTMKMPKEDLTSCGSGFYTYSLNGRIMPRFEFVSRMEGRHGKRVNARPQSYLMYSNGAEFEKFLTMEFGESAVPEFNEFILHYETHRRPQMTDIDISDYERMMLDEHMLAHYKVSYDNMFRRKRVLKFSRYLQKELGAEVEQAWRVLNQGFSGKKLVQRPLETIMESVSYFKEEGGWSNEQILRIFLTESFFFSTKSKTMAAKVELFREYLGMTERQTFVWVAERVRVMRAGQLREKLEYALGPMKLSRETLKSYGCEFYGRSFERWMKPRFEFVSQMEERCGQPLAIHPHVYLSYPPRTFENALKQAYGEHVAREYDDYYTECMKRLCETD